MSPRTSLLIAALFGVAAPARAQTFGAELDYFYGNSHVNGRRISPAPGVSVPAALAGRDVRLVGSDAIHGGSLRIDVLIDSMRFGGGGSLYGISDGVDAEADSATVDVSALWGQGAEVFLGYEFLRGPVYGYFDLRGSFNALSIELETRATSGARESTMYHAYVFGFGPRLGALVPIGHSTMLDIGVYQRIVGDVASTVLFVGVGYWQNDRRDPFSDELKRSWRGDF